MTSDCALIREALDALSRTAHTMQDGQRSLDAHAALARLEAEHTGQVTATAEAGATPSEAAEQLLDLPRSELRPALRKLFADFDMLRAERDAATEWGRAQANLCTEAATAADEAEAARDDAVAREAAAVERARTAEDALAEIRQLVEYEWRLKDHAPTIVLGSIDQVLAAVSPDCHAAPPEGLNQV